MKKSLFLISVTFFLLILTSCWISPNTKDYEIVEGIYYFHDFETMKSVIIPKINSSFTDWHWNSDTFDKKYDEYLGNINYNEDDRKYLKDSDYYYAVRNSKSGNKVQTKQKKTISGEYFWITEKNGNAVVFYQN